MPVRSTQFAKGKVTGTTLTKIYTVPSGYLALLKWYSLTDVSTVAGALVLSVRPGGDGSRTWFIHAATPGVGVVVSKETWFALDASDEVYLQNNAATGAEVRYQLSGALLAL